MNLQQQKTDSDIKTKDESWRRQSETATDRLAASVQSPQPQQAQRVGQTVVQARYAPEVVERLITRASLIQDTHRQTLSPEQIEAIAAEVGIQPEFIQAAIAQEQQTAAGTLSPHSEMLEYAPVSSEVLQTGQQTIGSIASSCGVIAGYSLVMALLLAMNRSESGLFVSLVFIVPALIALGLGAISRSRRWGAIVGLVLAVSVIFACMVGLHASPNPADFKVFALMIGTGAVLGAAGAEGRRQVSKRLVKNRSHRTVIRERAC